MKLFHRRVLFLIATMRDVRIGFDRPDDAVKGLEFLGTAGPLKKAVNIPHRALPPTKTKSSSALSTEFR